MKRYSWVFLSVGGILMAVGFTQPTPQTGPTSEQVFKNIQVFKGVPADDLIPSMEFMAASLKVECSDCHNPQDYSQDTKMKDAARKMVLMQRDINAKNFNNKLEVTCMTCHRGSEKPVSTPLPTGVVLRHEPISNPPKPESLFEKHLASVGKAPLFLTRIGTLSAPNDVTHKIENNPLEFIQANDGKFVATSGQRRFGSDGKQAWYMGQPMAGEPAFLFGRIGRTWRGESAFNGLEKATISGADKIGNSQAIVVRASRPATSSTEELWFDNKTGLLLRLVNIRRSSLGAVVTSIDYSDYKAVDGAKVPMKVVMSFAGDEKWIMSFKSAKVAASVDEKVFGPTGK